MHKSDLISTNKEKANIITFLLIIVLIAMITISYLIAYVIPTSELASYLSKHIDYVFLLVVVISYFVATKIYYYRIKIDSCVVNISSSAFIFLIKNRDFVDISHDMLVGYSFFNKSLSLNKTLILNIKRSNGSVIAKRFNLTLIREKKIKEIRNTLDRIIVKNN